MESTVAAGRISTSDRCECGADFSTSVTRTTIGYNQQNSLASEINRRRQGLMTGWIKNTPKERKLKPNEGVAKEKSFFFEYFFWKII